ncbi:MAG: hypothetical protein CMO81_01870 [Waddliaceae bacterium]|nr:hypothetical protein [Waddliaceae bacterium]
MLRSLQPTIHVIFSLFFYLTVFLSTSLDAKIIQVPSLYCLEKHLESQDTWVILDVDEVLLVAEDPILQRLQRPVFWSLFKKYTEGMPKEKQDALMSDIWLQHRYRALEEENARFIRCIQKKGYTVFAVTALPAGKSGNIPKTQDYRWNQLNRLGWDFSRAFSIKDEWVLEDGSQTAILDRGIVYSGKMPKGKAVVLLLERLERKPKRVVAVDDWRKNLESLEEELEPLEIEFLGLELQVEELQNQKIDLEHAEKQFKNLVEKGKWY